MKKNKLLQGLIVIILGGTILFFVVSKYAEYKGLSIRQLWNEMFVKKVEEIINGDDRVIYLSSDLSDSLTQGISDWAEENYVLVYFSDEVEEDADYVVSTADLGGYDLAWKRYFVPVVSVESFLDGITTENFVQLVAGNSVEVDGASYESVVDIDAENYVSSNYSVGVSVTSSSDCVNQVYGDTSKIGIVPFDKVNPKVKIIGIDDGNLLTNFDEDSYPFVENVWVKEGTSSGLFDEVREILGDVNFNPDAVTTVVVTGTSVMGARGLYQKSEEVDDPIYPIREVADILRNADIAHVSNEAAFVEDCQQGSWSLVFCGTLESFGAFTFAGIDVVGLTGNHILDYGNSNFINTLELYEENEIQYFGGGENFSDAHASAVEEVNEMTFAFLGYNNIPPVSSFATESQPGTVELDMNQMITDITDATSKYDFVLVDMQWGSEYEHDPLSYQIEYGRAAIDAGADIVTGVHPHWVQKLEYYGNGVIFYGLGNLLFDQMWSQTTREGVMVRHYFYDGRHVGFDLIPTIIYEGAQPRPVSGSDAERIINYLF